MKICFYTETALPKLGGQQMVVDALARELGVQGHEVVVLTQARRRPLVAEDSGLGYRVVRHPRFVSTTRLVGWYRRFLLRLHRREGFDVIHCHSVYPTGWMGVLAREELDAPIVITSHGGDVREGGLRVRKPWLGERYVRAVREADALIAISRFTREGFVRLGAEEGRIVDIPNGVDVEEYAEEVERPGDLDEAIRAEEYFLFLGRLARQKGVDILLEAMALRRGRGGVELVIAGDGPERGALEARMVELGLKERVRFVGARVGKEKAWLLRNSMAAVMPSREYEAFGLVILESYAAGRPVIASDLAGLADLVRDGETGFVFGAESGGELAGAMEKMMGMGERLKEMGDRGRKMAGEYAWGEIARRHAGLYDQVVREFRQS